MKLQLQSGRWIQLANLDQHLTYGGLLCGRPIRLVNDNHIESLIHGARRDFPAFGKPFTIAPPSRQQGIPAAPSDEERLPAVSCRAVFESGALEKPNSDAHSSMLVLWFQDDFALPIDEAVLSQLELIDWELRATDWMP